MTKQILIILSILSAVLAQCHSSCATCDQNRCLTCLADNSEVDQYERVCKCKENFYASSLSPLICLEKIEGSFPDECEQEIALNVYNFQVDTSCYYETIEIEGQQLSFVYSDVSIDSDHSQLTAKCREKLITIVQYNPKGYINPKEDDNYISLPVPISPADPYISDLPGGNIGDKRLKFPLVDIYNIAFYQNISNNGIQIIQEVHFRILIGFERKQIRSHRWIMTVYTNRNQIQTFSIDVDIQRTEGCQGGEDCIVIADLDVTGNQYQHNWVNLRANNQYTVGDWMYMRIWFKDTTYKKQLSFKNLFFKNEEGFVFDYTSLTDNNETKWNSEDKSLHIKLKLIEPGLGSTVQVNMLIETSDARLRRTLEENGTPIRHQFQATISSYAPSTQNQGQQDNNDTKSISLNLVAGLLNILLLILFI